MAIGCSQGDQTPAVSAPPDAATESATAATPTPEDTAAESSDAAASVQGCLDLVSQSRFAEAIASCTLAIEQAPENQEVAAALETAKSEAAAASQQAAVDATSAAQKAADAQTQEISEGMGKAIQ
jgi:hypothetical protein